ncbi:MAG TPA: hypothetical protein PK619_04150, partial [bacterium]|nr:hypothetical protein [bacterium]
MAEEKNIRPKDKSIESSSGSSEDHLFDADKNEGLVFFESGKEHLESFSNIKNEETKESEKSLEFFDEGDDDQGLEIFSVDSSPDEGDDDQGLEIFSVDSSP